VSFDNSSVDGGGWCSGPSGFPRKSEELIVEGEEEGSRG